MCFPIDAMPPIPPIEGAAVDSEDLVLEAADGNKFAAFAARTDAEGAPGVVVLPDVRGLFPFYEELALRFAERGINAVAFDFFGRTAGVGKRDAAFPAREHAGQTTPEGLAADVRRCVEYLRSPDGGGSSAIFTLGFCFGGGHSWQQAANGHGLAGVIGFYGRPGPGANGRPGPAQRAPEFKAPVLALMGGADEAIPQEDVEMYRKALEDAGVEHEIKVYPGAPHSFFDREHEQFAADSEDAWQRVLAFIEKHSG